MALDFPASPSVGQKYPASPLAGIPTYTWDGEKWTTQGGSIVSASPGTLLPLMDAKPALVGVSTNFSREDHVHPVDTSRAPFDAMAYSGLQINGACEVDQPAAGNVQLTNSAAYFTDSWVLLSFGALGTLASSNGGSLGFPIGFSKYVRIYTVTPVASLAAGDLGALQTRIEGYRTARLQWGTANAQPITIGFWVTAAAGNMMTVSVQNNGATRTYLVDVPVTNGWTYRTVTIPGDTSGTWLTTNGMGMAVTFCFGGGANQRGTANAWNAGNFAATAQTSNLFSAANNQAAITGVIVLPGNEAPSAARSPFVMRSYDQELVTCKRYLRLIQPEGAGVAASATTAYFTVRHEGLRAAPTASMTAPALITNVVNAEYVQSTANVAIYQGRADWGQYSFTNFTGMTAGAAVLFRLGTDGLLKLDARL